MIYNSEMHLRHVRDKFRLQSMVDRSNELEADG